MGDNTSLISADSEMEQQNAKGKRYKRNLWTETEDNAITELVKEIGECNWGTIAERMQTEFGVTGRTGKQCRERWHNHLSPNIIKNPLTKTEEHQIFILHIDEGLKWAEIGKKLGKRSCSMIKNHFYAALRRYTRRANKIMKAASFKGLTKYPLFKLTLQYIYKCLVDHYISCDEFAIIDSK